MEAGACADSMSEDALAGVEYRVWLTEKRRRVRIA
jgi:hypothetical protein